MSANAIGWVEQGRVPDSLIRAGIRRLLRQRIDEIASENCEEAAERLAAFVEMMDSASVAPIPQKANEQHYEVPASFFSEVLGEHRKYSSCYWPDQASSLEDAEAASLRITCERAELVDGMRVLELGCGWGSLTLWIATHYPNCQITAVSNSNSQRREIETRAAHAGVTNIEVITADMNDFDTKQRFDRVVSLEMFEHMRNYRLLYQRIHDWLLPGGQFLMHVFCHRLVPYEFVDRDASDWMSRHFFSGGIMPSDALPKHFQDHLRLRNHWRWNGEHYAKTLNGWLARMDQRRAQVMPILEQTYGDDAEIWWSRWRVFFIASAELFGFNHGQEWWVSHYLFQRPAD